MVDAPLLARMQDGAVLINTARGALVDHDALLAELRTGRISAGLDVYLETLSDDQVPLSAYRRLSNVVITPGIAGPAGTITKRMTLFIAEELARYLRRPAAPSARHGRHAQLRRLAGARVSVHTTPTHLAEPPEQLGACALCAAGACGGGAVRHLDDHLHRRPGRDRARRRRRRRAALPQRRPLAGRPRGRSDDWPLRPFGRAQGTAPRSATTTSNSR